MFHQHLFEVRVRDRLVQRAVQACWFDSFHYNSLLHGRDCDDPRLFLAEKLPQLDCHFVSVHVSESYVHQHELVGSAAFSLLALFTLLDGLLSVICVVSFSRAVLLKEHQERFHDHFAVFYNEDLWTVTLTFLLLYIRLPAFVNPSIFFSFPIALD